MKVLFAVNNDKIAESIIRKYQEEYKEIISSKTVYYFNAIIKELQKDKSYDRIVISEDLEMFSNDNYQAIDKFIFEKMDAISDEATNTEGNDVPIIFLCTDRRTKSDPLLAKLFGLGIYGVLVGQDRSIQKVCNLLYKPRSKKEAKQYYKVESENVGYVAEDNNSGVSESEIQNIVYHYKKIGNNVDKCVKSFDSIYAQYSEEQVKLIVNVLPVSSRLILEENSETYRNLMGIKGQKKSIVNNDNEKEYVEKTIVSENKLTKPVIIPTQVNTKNVLKVADTEEEKRKKQEQLAKEKAAAEAKRKKEEKIAREKAEAEAKRKEEERIAREKAAAEAKRKEEERIAREKAAAEAKRKEEERIAREKAAAEAKKKEEERIAREKAAAEAKRKEEERIAKEKAEAEAKRKEEERIAKKKAEAEVKKKEMEKITKESAELNQPVKRGRGRPRKNPIEPVIESVAVVATTEKRKRGRPRKNPIEEVVEDKVAEAEEKISKENSKIKNKIAENEDIDSDDTIVDLFEEIDNEENVATNQIEDEIYDDIDDEEVYDDDDLGLADLEDDDFDLIDFDDDDDDELNLPEFEDSSENEDDNSEEDELLDFEDEDEDEDDDFDLSEFDDEDADLEDDELLDFDDEDDEIDLSEFNDEDDEIDLSEFDDEDDEIDLSDLDEKDDKIDVPELDDKDNDLEDNELLDFDDEEDDDDFDLLEFDEEDDRDLKDNNDSEDDELLDFEDEDDDFDLLEFDEEDDSDLKDNNDSEDDELFELEDEDEENDETANENIKTEDVDELDLLDFDDDDDSDSDISELEESIEENTEDDIITQHNGHFEGISNKNYKYDNDLANSIKDLQETEEPQTYNADIDNLITSNQKVVAFVGTSKNGTSFTVNNLADILASRGIKTAILDLTKNKNAFYTYTNNEEQLRETAYNCLEKLRNGIAEGIEVDKNLSIYTCLPGEDDSLDDATNIIQTLINNYTVVLLDCDFETRDKYFKVAQEIYLVQTLDVLTIQPLTAFLRDLKVKEILNSGKLRVIINKNIKVSSITEKMLINGMSSYNDPGMTYMTELFNSDNIKYATIPFDSQVYIKYLEGLVNCKISTRKYPKTFINSLNKVADMVYPVLSAKKEKNYNDYSKKNKKFENAFSDNTNSTLDKMKKNY